MPLSGELFAQFQDALLDAFPDHGDFERVVRVGLGENLAAIAGGENLARVAFNLVKWAEAHGRTDDLLRAARKDNPGNAALIAFEAAYRAAITTGTASPRGKLTEALPQVMFIGIAIVGVLLSDVVVSHLKLPPHREWLRALLRVGFIVLLVLVSYASMWLAMRKAYGTRISLKRIKPLPIAAILMLAVLAWLASPRITQVYAQNVQHCLPDRICVLVAQFEPKGDPTADELTDEIYDEVNKALKATSPERFTVQKVSLAKEAIDDETPGQTVERLARERGASLAVWGAVHKKLGAEPQADVQYYSADPMGVSEASATQPYRAVPLGYDALDPSCDDCMIVPTGQDAQIVTQAQIVAYAVSGLFHYVRYRPRAARQAFEAALCCAGELDREACDEVKVKCAPDKPVSDWNPGLLYYYRGKAFSLEGDFGKAIANLEEAARKNPQDPAALIGIAAAYQGWLGDGHESDTLVKQALDKASERANEWLRSKSAGGGSAEYDLGFAYELAKDYDAAGHYYQMAADDFSQQGKSPYVSLIALARVQQKAEALADGRDSLQEAIGADPDLAWAYIAMAQSYRDDPQQAEQWLRKAQGKVDLYDAAADIAEAGLCETWQDYQCASEAYKRALDKRPDAGNLHSVVGDFYRKAAEESARSGCSDAPALWDNARNYYEEAQWLRPNDPLAHERFAYVLLQQGKYGESAEQYQQAIDLALSPAYVPDGVYYDMAVAEEKAGEAAKAIDSYHLCLQSTTNPELKKAAEDKIEQLQNTLNK